MAAECARLQRVFVQQMRIELKTTASTDVLMPQLKNNLQEIVACLRVAGLQVSVFPDLPHSPIHVCLGATTNLTAADDCPLQ